MIIEYLTDWARYAGRTVLVIAAVGFVSAVVVMVVQVVAKARRWWREM